MAGFAVDSQLVSYEELGTFSEAKLERYEADKGALSSVIVDQLIGQSIWLRVSDQ
jgi:hypothetical protein